ncbi:MAG: hypothetical protein ACRCZI_07340 [Cetobacterium sp.]
MKFYELIFLLKEHIKKVKSNNVNNPAARYIAIAYNNILSKLNSDFSENESVNDKKINNMDITKHMKEKLIELNNTKISKKLEDEIKNQKKVNKLKKELDELLGIGAKKADELISEGLKTVKQLESKKWFDKLNTDTQIMITHKPLRSLEWDSVNSIEKQLTEFEKSKVNSASNSKDFEIKNRVTLVGSYIRKKPIMRDIDILFLSNAKTNDGVNPDLERYIIYLKKQFGNKVWFYTKGSDKASFVFHPYKSPSKKHLVYKADIFMATPENYYSMLLYTTGSKDHNIKMRAKAKRLGYLLNQDGIFKQSSNQKINKKTDDEKKIFEILDMNYIIPERRF